MIILDSGPGVKGQACFVSHGAVTLMCHIDGTVRRFKWYAVVMCSLLKVKQPLLRGQTNWVHVGPKRILET